MLEGSPILNMFGVDINDEKPAPKKLPNDESEEPFLEEANKAEAEEDKKQADSESVQLDMLVQIDKISDVIKEGAEVVKHMVEDVGLVPQEGEAKVENSKGQNDSQSQSTWIHQI